MQAKRSTAPKEQSRRAKQTQQAEKAQQAEQAKQTAMGGNDEAAIGGKAADPVIHLLCLMEKYSQELAERGWRWRDKGLAGNFEVGGTVGGIGAA
jgi:hypothetical protein